MKYTTSLFVIALLAQGAAAPPNPTLSTHEESVKELFTLLDLERTMLAGAASMIDVQVQANPELVPYRDVMLEWAGKYLTWEAVEPSMTKLYVEAFDESEIRELITFYRSPTGRKALEKLPELMQKGAVIGSEVAKTHQAELEAMILERQRELDTEDRP